MSLLPSELKAAAKLLEGGETSGMADKHLRERGVASVSPPPKTARLNRQQG